MTMKYDLTLILGLAGLLVIAAGLDARSTAVPEKTAAFMAGAPMVLNINCPKTAEDTKLEALVGSLALVLL
jgi:hypothetical protein